MKKQIKPACPADRKLNLNKSTIANLNAAELDMKIGGTSATVFCYTLPLCKYNRTYYGNRTCRPAC